MYTHIYMHIMYTHKSWSQYADCVLSIRCFVMCKTSRHMYTSMYMYICIFMHYTHIQKVWWQFADYVLSIRCFVMCKIWILQTLRARSMLTERRPPKVCVWCVYIYCVHTIYLYIYIYTYVCVCVYTERRPPKVCTCMCTYVHAYRCFVMCKTWILLTQRAQSRPMDRRPPEVCVCTCVCVCVYIYIHIYAYGEKATKGVRVHMRVHVCMYIYIYTYTHTHRTTCYRGHGRRHLRHIQCYACVPPRTCTYTHTQTGQLAIEDMAGGTFTVSNGGVFGSMMSTPIINQPQSAICKTL
jgi:hypothetical protein